MASDDDAANQPLVAQNEDQETTTNTGNSIDGASTASNNDKHILENASSGGDAKNNDGSGTETNEEEDDIDSAMARMMAIQEEEQQEEEEDVAEGHNEHDIDFDPNIAYLGDNNDDFQDDDILVAAAAANNDEAAAAAANNPAAIALRQRQALQNQRRQDQLNAMNNQPFLTRQLLKFLRPLCRYTPLSIICALILLHHTLRTRQQFYLAVVYVQSSKLSYIIFGNAIIALAVSTFSLLTKLFLDGGLRPNERDAIGENIRWDVTETCLALTIFRSELDVVTAVMFLGLVVVKCLHWSAELRGSHLRMTEEVFVYPEDEDRGGNTNDANNAAQTRAKSWYQRIPRLRMTHIRYYLFLCTLLIVDLLAVAHCALSVATDGPSVQILFGFEFAIMLISAASSLMSYNLHVIDGLMGFLHHWAEGEHHHNPVGGMAEPTANEGDANTNNGPEQEADAAQPQQPQQQQQQRPKSIAGILLKHFANPWRDQRATFSFVIELQAQAAKFLFYVVFFAIVFTYYGMPINIFREVYVSFQQLRRRLIAFNNYRRLTTNMEKRFESVTHEEELDRLGHTCIICRDQMDLLGGCKKLPGCGHAFHTHCLREWLVQQQTCPTCRADIAANEARMKKEKEKEEAAAAAATTATEATPSSIASEGEGGEASVNNGTAPVDQGQGNDQSTSSQSEPLQQPASDELPVGWTEHVDRISGNKYYYNKDLNKSTWERPKKKLSFPCLYRVTSPAGVLPAETFENVEGTIVPKDAKNVIRSIPVGKIIVCTSEIYEESKEKIARSLLRIPDGYVMGCDVERLFELTTSSI